jgi:tellurite resistance protein TehA-like permease
MRRSRLPYGLGWWAFTFPLGAFTASTLVLGRWWHAGAIQNLAAVLFLALVFAWGIVSVRTLRAVRSGAAWRRSGTANRPVGPAEGSTWHKRTFD